MKKLLLLACVTTIANISTIGAVPAAGNSTTIRTYTWIHTTPATGINYYRVRQTDLDNKFTWSKILPLLYNPTLTKTPAIPNPFTNSLTICGRPLYQNRTLPGKSNH